MSEPEPHVDLSSAPTVRVRVAAPADAAAVEAVFAASYDVLLRSDYDEATLAASIPLMARANPVLLTSGRYWLAETAQGQATGCGGWSEEEPRSGATDPGLAHIRHFAVRADQARRGVGRALFAACEAQARAACVREWEVLAALSAVRFYGSLGFVEVEATTQILGGRVAFACVRMRRPLGGSPTHPG